MKSRARLRFAVSLLVLLWMSVCVTFAQSARDLHDIGMANSDQCAGLKQVCKAAGMDKKYRKDCEDFVVSLNITGNRNLNSGYEKLETTPPQLTSALRYAKNVCDYDSTLSAKKQELLDKIQKAEPHEAPAPVDISPAKITEADAAFSNGDFEAASAAAKQVTDKELQRRANVILQKIQDYRSAMQDGHQKETSDARGAIASYRSAESISPKGPGDPAGRIKTLEAQIQLASAQTPPPPPRGGGQVQPPPPQGGGGVQGPPQVAGGGRNQQTPNGGLPPLPPVDPRLKIAAILADAKEAEAHNLQDALKLFQAAQRLQPGNAEAVAGLNRVQEAIKSRPEEQAKILADALRSFYTMNYADAEYSLTLYLASTTAKYRGAAFFYLGASTLYREILETSGRKLPDVVTSPQVQRPFRDARSACYRPINKYLSPVVLSAWNVSANTPACTR